MRKILSALLFSVTQLQATPDVIPVTTDQAPKAIGPYSQAVIAGPFCFVSGQIGVDPKTGKLAGDTIEAQTEQALKNIEAILASQSLSAEHVVRVEVFLKDLSHFQAMNGIFGKHFNTEYKPARTTIQIVKLPQDALVEITAQAYIPAKS